jgi:hypothetical protein
MPISFEISFLYLPTGPCALRSARSRRRTALMTRPMEESVPVTFGKNGTLVLGKVRTGFRLRGRLDETEPRRLEVLTAYDILRGNPFQRYSPLDFRMDEVIAVQPRGVRVVARRDNRLEFEIEATEFEVLVTRFDENRDLRVKVRPLEEGG